MPYFKRHWKATSVETGSRLYGLGLRFKIWREEKSMKEKVDCLRKRFERAYEKGTAKPAQLSMDDFTWLHRLGEGRFSEVELVVNRKTDRTSALKVVRLEGAYKVEKERLLANEMRLLSSFVHPFIASMECHFVDGESVCIVLPYLPCGSLVSLLNEMGRCSSELTRFYAAQLVMAVDFMHSVGIVHRDLKPDNVVIDADGYLKVIDMGIAKRAGNDRMTTPCGTPSYASPELIRMVYKKEGTYDKSIDWWSLGVTMFNMMTGKVLASKMRVGSTVVTCSIDFPPYLERVERAILEGLLKTRVEQRLGYGKRGAKDVTEHPYFHGVRWSAIFFKKVKAPHVPKDVRVLVSKL